MSEFKFACPVCGQHITADSSASGSHLTCPTCFQKIVVPQAPASDKTKFILSAAKADRQRPATTVAELEPVAPARKPSYIPFVVLVLVLGAGAAAGFYVWKSKVAADRARAAAVAHAKTNASAPEVHPVSTIPEFPVPTNFSWTMDIAKAVVPQGTASGRLHGRGFLAEKAILQATNLTLRIGSKGAIDLGVSLVLFGHSGEDWGGKAIEFGPEQPPPVPKVVLRWKNDQGKAASKTYAKGYALRLVFGRVEKGHVPGKIYLCLPDAEQSFLAGTFDAEIRKPQPPKPKAAPVTAQPK